MPKQTPGPVVFVLQNTCDVDDLRTYPDNHANCAD